MSYRTIKSQIKVEGNKANNYTDFFHKTFRNILLVSVPLVIISALVLSLPRTSARISSSDNFTVSVLSSCTLSSKVNDEHSINTINGTYNADVGRTTLTTFCNDRNGYVVYVVGDSDNTIGNSKLISSINSNYDIVSGTDTSGNTSQWAMKLSALSSNIGDTNNPGYITNNNNETVATNQGTDTPAIDPSYNNTYGIVPTTWTRVVYKPSGTVNSTSGSSFSTTYSIYTSPTQPAGTYTGQVKYLLTHPSAAEPDTNYFIMQEVANWKNDLDEGESVQAIDIRDGKIYWATKLKDGNVWMTQNLDLDLIADHTYTHNDTDLGWDPNSFNVNASWTLTGGPSTISWDSTSSAYPGWQNSDSLPYSADPGDKYHYTSGSTEDDIVYSSLSECINAGRTDCIRYSVGNYYNFTAAIASNNSASLTSGNAPNSICPAGWRLPSVSSNDFGILLKDYDVTTSTTGTGNNGQINYASEGFNKIRTSPLYFVRSSFTNGSGNGAYLYNAVINSGYNRRLHFDSNTVNLTNATYRYSAHSIRCIAR